MPLVKPLSKRRARCAPESVDNLGLPAVPEPERLRKACRDAWGQALEWSIVKAAPCPIAATATDHRRRKPSTPELDIVATTVLDGGWVIGWSGPLLARAIALALHRTPHPVELRRPLTRFDCGAGAWVVTQLLSQWLGLDAPAVQHMEPGWCPPRPLPSWRLDVAWRCVERGRMLLWTPRAPRRMAPLSLSESQQRRISGWPVELRPRLDALRMSPGSLEALRPGDFLRLDHARWRAGRLAGPLELSAGPLRRRAWLEVPGHPAQPALRIGAAIHDPADRDGPNGRGTS